MRRSLCCAGSEANDTGRLKLVKSHKRSHPKRAPLSRSLSLPLAAHSRHALCSLTYKNTETAAAAEAETAAEAVAAPAGFAVLQHGKCCCCCCFAYMMLACCLCAPVTHPTKLPTHTCQTHTRAHTRTRKHNSPCCCGVSFI